MSCTENLLRHFFNYPQDDKTALWHANAMMTEYGLRDNIGVQMISYSLFPTLDDPTMVRVESLTERFKDIPPNILQFRSMLKPVVDFYQILAIPDQIAASLNLNIVVLIQ